MLTHQKESMMLRVYTFEYDSFGRMTRVLDFLYNNAGKLLALEYT